MDRTGAIAAASERRLLKVESALGKGAMLLTGFEGEEAISQLFRFTLDVVSPRGTVGAEDLIGTPISWTVAQDEGAPRNFHGIVRGFSLGAPLEDGMRAYRLEVVPWAWFLTQTTDCRIFQRMSARDVIQAVLEENRTPWVHFDLSHLSGAAAEREYCVQYGESDWDFVSRLAEDEGVFYHFRHEAGRHVLVMADATSAYFDLAEPTVELDGPGQSGGIADWARSFGFRPSRWVQQDYNFETPRTDLIAESQARLPETGGGAREIFEYPGGHADRAAGEERARIRTEEIEAGFATAVGTGGCRHMAPCGRFALGHHPAPEENGLKYVVTQVAHMAADHKLRSVAGGPPRYSNSFACIPAAGLFRPPRHTPRPVMRGPQTAMVVGAAGEEIDCDHHGRVRVQFHWDRRGRNDENSSCWIRVAQPSAGRGWGHQFIPRIGTEVVVDFLDGDPDRPLITGTVYNADETPPFPVPDEKTRSGIRTRSTKGGGTEDFNELRFEDRMGEEEVYFHAQKDFRRLVENDDSLEVGRDRTVVIERDLTETLKTGNRRVEIEMGNDALTIATGNRTTKLDLGKDSCEAMQSIELRVGQSSITIDQTGVTIKGMVIKVEGTAMAEMKAPMTQVKGDAMLTVRGGLVMIN
ncbi:type VI secretion system Vgr family protein [Arenibaculum pallidiluteum]|uniref:type VI secretion system Vgr family protein n=1 Tax=Arenibaculum pallidiluteum TaxID=2812559 RepID=UPI001A96C7AA|nr:type VI secretion system tip protein VgrG [Arenibaculum pallidiluteum]